MLKRSWLAVVALALVAAACGRPDIDVRARGGGEEAFVPLVVDVEGISGSGVSLATDGEGNPHLTYLALPEEAEGDAPPPDPLAPTLPAVLHAHLVDNIWTRGPVAAEQDITEDDQTALVVDPDGIHHVAWTAGGQVLYSSNAEGDFAEEPEVVAQVDALGLSITVDDRGAPMIAYVDELTEAEGPAALVRVAAPGNQGWEVETAAEAGPDEPVSTAVAVAGTEVLVAYGSEGATQVAGRGPNRWTSEVVDEAGGAGVSMDLDADGNPHLAYLDSAGAVKHAHSIEGSPWEISDVGEGATTSPASIAVDDQGVHHVSWQTDQGVAYASNDTEDGAFAEQELPPATGGGVQPKVGAGLEGTAYVAWFDQGDGELQMAVRSDAEPFLAVPSPTGPPGGGTAPAACQPEGTELQIVAVNLAFDTDCLATPAAEPFTIEFDNQDSGIPHNVSIYTDESAAEVLFQEPPFPGPDAVTYEPGPIEEEGDFFFQCDVHPATMTGTFVVAGAAGGGGEGGANGGGGGGGGGGGS